MKQCWGPLATGLSQTSGYISPAPWLSVATAVQSNSAPKVVAIPRVGPESQTVVLYLICISQGTGVLSLIAVMVFGGPSIPSSLSMVRCVRLETYRPQASLDGYVCTHFGVKKLDVPGLGGISASVSILPSIPPFTLPFQVSLSFSLPFY